MKITKNKQDATKKNKEKSSVDSTYDAKITLKFKVTDDNKKDLLFDVLKQDIGEDIVNVTPEMLYQRLYVEVESHHWLETSEIVETVKDLNLNNSEIDFVEYVEFEEISKVRKKIVLS